MKSDRLELFKEVAYRIFGYNRLMGTEGHKRAHYEIESLLEQFSCAYTKEVFTVNRIIPKQAWIDVKEGRVKAVAYLGSKEIEKEAYIKEDYIEGDIALIPDLTREKALQAQERGAIAIVTYRGENAVRGHIYGNYLGVSIPILSIDGGDLHKVADFKAKIHVSSVDASLRGANLLMEIGRGPIVYLIAHMDTVQEVYGALGNGVSFLLLIFLYQELKNNYNAPYRLRFLITDGREVGMEGAKFHLSKNPKHVFYCINLEGVGWHNPCVIYEDGWGYNGERINDLFYRHAEDLKFNVSFCRARDRDGDHIPFKEKGVQTLYLSSHPLNITRTVYDNYDAINWDSVVIWYEVILSFLRRFHKL